MYISNVISSLLFNTVPGPEDSEYSCAAWKRVPTTLEVIFALALPYRPPESPVGAFLWRKRVWFESTFALTMLQPWEKLCLRECRFPVPAVPYQAGRCSVFHVAHRHFAAVFFIHSSWILLLTALVLYFPNEIAYLIARGRYYLFGEEPVEAAVATAVGEAVTKLNATASRVLTEL